MKLERTVYGAGHQMAVFYPEKLASVPTDANGYYVHLSLHGLGAVGNDIDKMISDAELARMLPGYQCDDKLFVCPVTPSNWKQSTILEAVFQFLNQKMNGALSYHLTGISLGGIGCYAMMARYPDFFNTVGIVAGRNEGYAIPPDSRAAIRAWHGEKDTTVPFADGRRSIGDLDDQGYLNEHTFMPMPDKGHGIWNIVYHQYYFPWIAEKLALADVNMPMPPIQPIDPGAGQVAIEYVGQTDGALFELRKPAGDWATVTGAVQVLTNPFDRIRITAPKGNGPYAAKIEVVRGGKLLDSAMDSALRPGGKLVLYNADLEDGDMVRFTVS